MRTLFKIQLSLLSLVLAVVVPVASYAAEGKIMLGQTPSTTFPIVIDEPGSYVLTSNLTVSTTFNCIEISADNVTLDLNGFALVGPGSGSAGSGIYVNDNNNITVMNGTVRDFMSTGIYFLSSKKNQLKDLKCTNNGQYGIYVENATVVNCIAEENGTDGIRAYYSTVKDCNSNNNSDDGFNVLSSTVLNCQGYYNGNRGIYSRRSTISNCTMTFSGTHGIEAYDSTIIHCTSYESRGLGTELGNGIYVTNSSVTNSTAIENIDHGINAENSTITNCVANDNNFGIVIRSNSTIANCTANGNNRDGIFVYDSTVTRCTANNNDGSGIYVHSRSRIEGNNVRSDEQSQSYGIYLWSIGRDNYVIKNTASDNSEDNFRDEGTNNYMPMTGDNRNYSF